MKKPTKKTWRTLFTVLGIYVAIMLGLEGVGQLAIRYFEAERPSGIFGDEILSHQEPVIGFGLKKNLDKFFGHWEVKTNSLGFRDKEISLQKPKDEFRIFVVGGSTTFGWGSTADSTFPAFLEEILIERFKKRGMTKKKIRVINAGVPWYASWHEAAFTLFRILPLQPDWIIIFDGLNDVANATSQSWTPIHLGYADTPTKIAYQKRQPKSDKNTIIELLKLSPTFSYFHARYQEKKQVYEGAYHPELWDQYMDYMEWLQKLTHASDIGFHVFLQPVIVLERDLLPVETATNASSLKRPEIAKAFRRLYLEGERRLLDQRKFRFTSLKMLFKDIKYRIYMDGLHYTGPANYLIAKAVANGVQDELYKKYAHSAISTTQLVQ